MIVGQILAEPVAGKYDGNTAELQQTSDCTHRRAKIRAQDRNIRVDTAGVHRCRVGAFRHCGNSATERLSQETKRKQRCEVPVSEK